MWTYPENYINNRKWSRVSQKSAIYWERVHPSTTDKVPHILNWFGFVGSIWTLSITLRWRSWQRCRPVTSPLPRASSLPSLRCSRWCTSGGSWSRPGPAPAGGWAMVRGHMTCEEHGRCSVVATSWIASLDRAPGKSCLLANTSSVAPANLCTEGRVIQLTRINILLTFITFGHNQASVAWVSPLPAAARWAPACSPPAWACLRCPPPTPARLCSQSSSSSRSGGISDPRHPKYST